MYRNDLPGGCHYGEQLKVYKGTYKKSLGKCSYFNNTFFAVDLNYVTQDEFVTNKEYYILLVLYNYQWWIFDYICIENQIRKK